MDHKEYFQKTRGMGILATSDGHGRVNTAIYSRPHTTGERELAFIMTERKSYMNLQENPYASYLYREEGNGYDGVRVSLRRTHEENDPERIRQLARRDYEGKDPGTLHLVHFEVQDCLPLVSSGTCPVEVP